MGFWKWLLGADDGSADSGQVKMVSCKELWDAAVEYSIRQLSFEVCVAMVANAFARCEFRTYKDHKETFGLEYWLWNYDPSINANSTAFLHKFVDRLYHNGEVLVVATRRRDGRDNLLVADSWEAGDPQYAKLNEYRKVTVDGATLNKTFREDEVLHLRLNQTNIKPVLDRLTESWTQMATIAMKHYNWDHGEHWKVHVDQMASGGDGFETSFAQMIEQQVKPFMSSENGVLPEFDGYDYERLGSGSKDALTDSGDIRSLTADIFDFTARGLLIPAVLVNGKVEATADANHRFLTYVIDPLCDQLQEEIVRKRYGFEDWTRGDYLRVDSSSILHYDLFSQAASVEKLVGSGVYSINDILRAAGQATINEPWADQHFLTKNFEDMTTATKPAGE